MKRKMQVITLVILCVFTSMIGCSRESGYKAYTGVKTGGKVLNIYSWNEEFKHFFETYYKVPEGVTVKWNIVTSYSGEYQKKLDEVLAEQSQAEDDDKVDLFLAEAGYVKKYVDGYLTQDVGTLGVTDLSNTYDYTRQICTASDGSLKGVSFQCCPSAVYYRRSIAKDVLGTDDPETVQKAMNSWSSFSNLAKLAKEKDYYITASCLETYRAFAGASQQTWVNDQGELVIDDVYYKWIEQTTSFVANGYTMTIGVWDDTKNEQLYKDGRSMCFFGPAWYYPFAMGNVENPQKGSYGDWAICAGPQAYFWGGTWLMAANGSDNTDLVADIMNTFINDQEICSQLVEKENQFTNNKMVNKKYASDSNYGNPALGGQNDMAVYEELASRIDASRISEYDQLLDEDFSEEILKYIKGMLTKEEAISSFKNYVKDHYPQVKIVDSN